VEPGLVHGQRHPGLFGTPIAGGGSWIEENAMLMAVV